MAGIGDFGAELIQVFIAEADEMLGIMEQGLLALEGGGDAELLNSIFRAAHTLKGSSGALGHSNMQRLAHAMENILDDIRAGRLDPNGDLIGLLLRGTDALRAYVGAIPSGDLQGDPNEELIAQLLHARGATDSVPGPGGSSVAQDPWDQWRGQFAREIEAAEAEGHMLYCVAVTVPEQAVMGEVRLFQAIQQMERAGRVLASTPTAEDLITAEEVRDLTMLVAADMPAEEIRLALGEVPDVTVVRVERVDRRAAPAAAAAAPSAQAQKAAGTSSSPAVNPGALRTVRVSVQLLNELMNVVGEMVTARTRMEQVEYDLRAIPGTGPVLENMRQTVTQMGRLIDQVHDIAMQTRLQTLHEVFAKLRRVVRDTARNLGKQVELQVSGEEVKVDRDIIDGIADPLLHMVRNSLDHGIEAPEGRAAAGKPETGTIRVEAEQIGGEILIRISDDGRGIDVDKVRQKAAERGLVSPEDAARMSDRDVIHLIFQPGFSTADAVTEVSGRGVGMDVVRRNLEKLHGSVSVETERGKGSTFLVRLPMTIAIQQVVLVRIGGAAYAIPISSISEIVEVSPDIVHCTSGGEYLYMRDHIYPLLNPGNLALTGAGPAPYAVICRVAGESVALVVEQVLRTQKIVVKPLDGTLPPMPGIVGSAILGDGTVALVLDPAQMVTGRRGGQSALL